VLGKRKAGNEARVFLGGYVSLGIRVGNAVWVLEATQHCGGYMKATINLKYFQSPQIYSPTRSF
jgi:hypothetical protein